MSSLCEQLVNKGKVEVNGASMHRPMDPALFAELRRIGNNANQIAHALNSNLPPDVQMAWRTARDLLHAIARQELFLQQVATARAAPVTEDGANAFIHQLAQALSTRTPSNDSPPAQARHVFQRSVQLHPSRRREGHE
jgi:Bacterial mobilisation protein (MobC)